MQASAFSAMRGGDVLFPNDFLEELLLLSSVLRQYWLGGRKGIRPVKTEWWVLAWLSVWCKLFAYRPADATATHKLLLH